MTAAVDLMAKLDGIVAMHDEVDHYRVANVLYEASLRGILAGDIPDQTMYDWVVKWATLPETRTIRDSNVIDLMGWLGESVDRQRFSRS